MPIKIACPKCKTVLQVPSKMAGKQARCKCGHPFKVPEANTQKGGGGSASGSAGSAMWDELTDSDFARRSPFDQVALDNSGKDEMETLKRFTHEEMEQKKKQAGVTRGVLKFISILSLLGAIFSVVVAVFFAAAPDLNEKLSGFLPLAKLDTGLGMTFFLILALLLAAAAVGLFLQAPWGWIAIAAVCIFLIAERGGAMGLVIQEGFSPVPFYTAMGPMLGVLFLTIFIYKGETQETCRVKTKIPMIVALLTGLALGGAAIAALFSGGS